MSRVTPIPTALNRRRSSKTDDASLPPSPNQRIFERLELLKDQHGSTWSKWKLRKRHPDERAFLIQLARNLGAILDSLDHGRRGEALEAAKGPHSAKTGDANKYVTRLVIRQSATTRVEAEDLVKRLTPYVGKYIAVAQQAGIIVTKSQGRPGEPTHFLARLFRDTPLDATLGDPGGTPVWARTISRMLDACCLSIGNRHGLATLFDRMDEANIYSSDESGYGTFHVTEWLSETFHKTELIVAGLDNRPVSVPERTEAGVPYAGLPVFVPRYQLASEWRDVPVGPVTLHSIEQAYPTESPTTQGNITVPDGILRFQVDTSLGIVPLAEGHNTATTLCAAFLFRPRVQLLNVPRDTEVRWLRTHPHVSEIHVASCDESYEVWKTAAPSEEMFQLFSDPFINWFVEDRHLTNVHDEPVVCPVEMEFGHGPWWVVPVNAESVMEFMGHAHGFGLNTATAIPHCSVADISTHLEEYIDASMLPGATTLAENIAPPDTLAAYVQCDLLARKNQSGIVKELENSAIRIRAAFENLEGVVNRLVDDAHTDFFRSFPSSDN